MPRQDANFRLDLCVSHLYVLWDTFLCCVNDIRTLFSLKIVQLKSSRIEETHGNLRGLSNMDEKRHKM